MSGTVDIGRLLVRIEANQAQLRSAMADAKKQVESFASTSKSSVSGFEAAWDKAGAGIARAGLQALATVASFQAAASAIGDTIKRADEAAAAQARLGTAIGSMARGREIFDQLSRSAQQTGTSATDAAGAFARLSVAARQVGATNQQTLQLVTTMQRLAIISGSSTQEAAASMQQFGQALASGKLQGDELRSLLENMPTLVEKLAGQLGVSVATLRQMGTEGKLTSDVVLPAMLRIAGDVNEQFARMPMTVSRATDSLSQAWSNLVVQVDRATGGSQALANVIKSASDQVQRMADRWVPPSALEQLQTARAEFERIAEAQRRIDERGRGTIQPEMTAQRRGGINTGLQRAAAAQTPTATREELAVREEEIQQLERLARADADVAAALSALEVDTAAAAAAEAARQRVLEQLKEATESFGGANDKQRDQMQALRTVIAEGDGALAKYGITAQVAASMLAAFEARVDSVRGVIASLDAQITQNAANMLGGFTGRLNQALAQAAQRYGGDQSRINAQEFIEIFDRVRVVQEQAGAAALTAAENELALARARATGNRGAEARVRAEQNYRRNLADGYRDTDAAAIRTAELAAADAQAASASQARLQPLAQVRQALQLSTTAAQNAAAQSRLSATAQREAAERDKARAEALKVARSGTEAYNRAYAEFLRLIQDTNRAEAEADYNKRVSTLNDEIALIQREVELIGELPGVRNEEIAALRIRQELIASGRAYTQQEIDDVVRLTRAREQAREGLRQYQDVMSRIKSVSEEIARDAATMIYEQMMDRKKGEDVVDWFKALFKRIAIQALAANILLPITTQIVGGMPGLFGINAGNVSAAQISAGLAAQQAATGGGGIFGGGGLAGIGGAYQAGNTLFGSYPGLSGYGNGLIGGGVGGAFNPGYSFNTGFGFADSALNTPIFGAGGSSGYGSMSQAALIDAGQAGLTYGQAGLGALGIAGGAYGVYSGLQTGGPKGYTQAAAGGVGIAGGAAGLAVAGGMTSAGGALAGSALGTAVAATAAWAPYIAAALAIAAMFMEAGKPTNAAAGASINLTAGAVNIENSGKQTSETAGARDAMAKLVTDTTNRISGLTGVRPSGYLGFELGQRDASRVVYNGNLVGTAGVGDQQGLADLIGRTIMMGFKDAPGLSAVERRILDASGSNVDMAANLLQQTKAIKDNYGADALNYGRNYTTQALWSAAEQNGGDIETMIAVLGKAAELTQAYGDALGPINEVAKQAIDMAWGTGDVDTIISAFQGAAELTKAYGEALDPNQNQAFRAIFNAAAGTGDSKRFLQAMQGAAELTKAYGDALNSADAMQVVRAGGANVEKIVSDLQWLFQVYRPLTAQEEKVSALAKAIEASNKVYNDAITKARELGLAEDVLAQKRDEAAEKLRQQVRDSYDAMMLEATGGSAVTQAVNTAKGIRANYDANAQDYTAVGRDPNALYAAQMAAAFKDLDIATLEKVVESLNSTDEAAASFARAALDAAKATEEANNAAMRLATAQNYDAQLRALNGQGWLNSIIEAANSASANANAYRDAGRDPAVLLAAQIKDIINQLDAATLATAAQNLQGLDTVTADFVRAAIETAQAAIATAQATQAMADAAAQAAQRIADAADYDAKMRAAMGLELVNTVVAIRQQIDAMADRYIAAGRDPEALYAAQVSASLQGKSIDELAKTAAALEGIDQTAADLATAALEQAIATQAQADAAAAAEQAARDAASAQQDAARAAEQASREQGQAAQEAQRAAEEIARAGQNIKDYIAKLKTGTTAGYSPTDRLAAAQAQYNADLALARTGDLDALARITSDSDALLSAAQAMYATGTQFQAIRDSIIAQLNALPAVRSAEQQMIAGLDGIRSTIETGNTRLSSISTSTASTVSKVSDSNSFLASIDTNGDGVISQMEASVAAQELIKQKAAENVLATGQVKDAVNESNTTGYSDNNLLLGIYQNTAGLRLQTSDVRLDLAAINSQIDWVRKYTGAAAINTMYGRPVAQEPGIGALSAKGNIFGDGALINAKTAVPMSIMGEAGIEAVVPLQRDPRTGRLGVASTSRGGASNDNSLADEFASYRVQSAKETMALQSELRATRDELARLTSVMQRRAFAS